jgi:iron complex outermembrane receptor protein
MRRSRHLLRTTLRASVSLGACLVAASGWAQEAVPEVHIEAPAAASGAGGSGAATDAASASGRPAAQLPSRRDGAATAYDASGNGVDFGVSNGGSNVLRTVGNLPSVDAPAIDPYGAANLPGSSKGIRVRGIMGQHGDSMSTVDGLPLAGANPGVGAMFLIPNEDIARTTLYQGPIAPNVISYFNSVGVIDSQIAWPKDKMGGEISQSVGSYNFLRTFARVDSGLLFDNTTKFFLSGAWTDADKWRGSGKSPDGKGDFTAGVETRPNESLDVKALVAHTQVDQTTYQGLTYAQASNLAKYRFLDFTGIPVAGSLMNWYGYNRQSFDVWSAFAEIAYKINADTVVTLKPYFFHEDGYYFDGMANGMVRQWLINHNFYGGVAELKTRAWGADFTLGYWGGAGELPGPPSAQKLYTPNPAGGLTFSKWGLLAQETQPNLYNSIYVLADRRFDALRVQAGLRYMWQTLAGINAMTPGAGAGDVSYSTALAASAVNAKNSVTPSTVGAALPFLALSYDVNRDVTARASFGVTYTGPAIDLWPAYQGSAAVLNAKGLNVNQLWHASKPETDDVVDLGFDWKFASPFGPGTFSPTVFYSRNHDQNVSYDPGVGVAFSQTVAESRSLGAQAMVRIDPNDNLSFFAAVGYQNVTFVENLPYWPGASAAVIASTKVNGTLIPDAPLWISTLGAEARWNGFTFAPIVHILSDRYGDTAHKQPIAGYATVDLRLAYRRPVDFGEIEASITVTNLFDASYIGQISTGYYQATSSSGIYYPGAPRAVVGKLAWRY